MVMWTACSFKHKTKQLTRTWRMGQTLNAEYQRFLLKHTTGLCRTEPLNSIVTDSINALAGNSSVNTVQHVTIEETVFSADLTDAPIGLAG
jgi:hypothetical protein